MKPSHLRQKEALDNLEPPKRGLANTLVSFKELKNLAQEIMQSADASMTGPSFELLVYLTIIWLRRVINDAIIFEEERRERMIKIPKSTSIYLQSIETAIQINGINIDRIDEDDNHSNEQEPSHSSLG